MAAILSQTPSALGKRVLGNRVRPCQSRKLRPGSEQQPFGKILLCMLLQCIPNFEVRRDELLRGEGFQTLHFSHWLTLWLMISLGISSLLYSIL